MFREAFVIKSNDKASVRSLCDSRRLRELMPAWPKFQAAHVRDVARLKGIYDDFAETLGKLARMGVAGGGTGGHDLFAPHF